MSTTELKQKLIGRINETSDENLLLEVFRLLELENGDFSVYPLTEEQISVVRESQQQVKNGRFLNEHDANNEIDKWLGK